MAGVNGSVQGTSDLPLVWPHPDGDPRLRFPQIAAAGVFTPQRLLAWALRHKCLCGCGRFTKPLRGRAEEGNFSYFNRHCWAKVARDCGYGVAPSAIVYPTRRDPKWLEAVRRENDDRRCSVEDTDWYVNMMVAHIEDVGITARAWCRQNDLSPQFVRMCLRSRDEGRRIMKYTAGVILKALGERMPPDIKTRYDSHMKAVRRRERVQQKALAKAS